MSINSNSNSNNDNEGEEEYSMCCCCRFYILLFCSDIPFGFCKDRNCSKTPRISDLLYQYHCMQTSSRFHIEYLRTGYTYSTTRLLSHNLQELLYRHNCVRGRQRPFLLYIHIFRRLSFPRRPQDMWGS